MEDIKEVVTDITTKNEVETSLNNVIENLKETGEIDKTGKSQTEIENIEKNIDKAMEDYESLTPEQKELVSDDVKKKLEEAHKKLEEEKQVTSKVEDNGDGTSSESIGLATKTGILTPPIQFSTVARNDEFVLGSGYGAYEKIKTYDITIKSNDTLTNVDLGEGNEILVKLEIPNEYKDRNIEIHHMAGKSVISSSTKVATQRQVKENGKKYVYFKAHSFSPYTLVATDKVNVNITAGSNGSVSSTGNQEIIIGTDLELTIIANIGYKVDKILVDGVDKKSELSSNIFTLTNVTANKDVKVSFTRDRGTGEYEEIGKPSRPSTSGGGGGGSSTPTSNTMVIGATTQSHTPYMTGYTENTFGPTNAITRAEVAAILSRIDNRYTDYEVYSVNFSDITGQNWYNKYVGFTNKLGILKGTPDGKFNSSANMKKSEFITAVARQRGFEVTGLKSKFSDAKGRWFEGYVAVLEQQGFIKGNTNGELGADNDITRAEVVTIINKILGREPNKDKIKTSGIENKFKDVKEGSWYYADVMEASQQHKINAMH